MIGRRYFAILPTPRLTELLSSYGFSVDTAVLSGELIVKRYDSRHPPSRDDDITYLKAIYPKIFASQQLTKSNLGYEQLSQHVDTEGFGSFWHISIFDDCEDIEDLIADLDSWPF